MNDVRDSLSLAKNKRPYFACHKENHLEESVAVPGGPRDTAFEGYKRAQPYP